MESSLAFMLWVTDTMFPSDTNTNCISFLLHTCYDSSSHRISHLSRLVFLLSILFLFAFISLASSWQLPTTEAW